jgi:hypothetical protein
MPGIMREPLRIDVLEIFRITSFDEKQGTFYSFVIFKFSRNPLHTMLKLYVTRICKHCHAL